MRKEQIPGGEIGERVLRGIEDTSRFLYALENKVEVIASALCAGDPNAEGAAGLLYDLSTAIYDKAEEQKELAGKARELAAIADGSAPFLPQTAYEREAIKVLREAQDRGSLGFTQREFLCNAVVKANAVFVERFAKPYPDETDVAAVVEALSETVIEQEAHRE